jgi:hypothetical protein
MIPSLENTRSASMGAAQPQKQSVQSTQIEGRGVRRISIEENGEWMLIQSRNESFHKKENCLVTSIKIGIFAFVLFAVLAAITDSEVYQALFLGAGIFNIISIGFTSPEDLRTLNGETIVGDTIVRDPQNSLHSRTETTSEEPEDTFEEPEDTSERLAEAANSMQDPREDFIFL